MKKKKIVLGCVLVLGAVQFIRPARNLAPGAPGKEDIIVRYAPPAEVGRALQAACYDCHSNHTSYPWYAALQPVGWWLAKHVNDGKRELNFSEFAGYELRTQMKRLEAIGDEVATRHMPLKSFTWMHRDARLSDAQVRALVDWTETLRDKIAEEK